MPNTIVYRPRLIDALISNGRIASYQSVFQPKNDVELVGAYLWNSHVTGAIYPLISTAEISLRNAIDASLSADLGSFWWSGARLICQSWRPAPQPHPTVLQDIKDNFVKATKIFITEQRRRYQRYSTDPHHPGVIAKTEFSTWELLLDQEFMGRGLIWPKHLGTVFAGIWTSQSAATFLTDARRLVATVREFRNRLFHHEPAWKGFGVITESDALRYLLEKIGRVESLIALIDPEKLNLLEKNGILRSARRACTADEIRRFQHLAQEHAISSISDLSTLVTRCDTDNTVLGATILGDQKPKFCVTPR
jgi:hypothetical protein